MNIKLDFNNIKVKESKKDFTVKILMLKGEKGEQGDLNSSSIVDNLTSSDSTKVLSAKQGKVLKDLVDVNTTKINKKPYYFDTVADMKAYNLSAGDMAITKGYYSANDGGGAEYNIVSTTSNYSETLNNNLKAEIIINEKINILQLGAKAITGFDNADIIQEVINISKSKYTIEIPAGTFEISKGLEVTSGSINMVGCGSNSAIKLISETEKVLLNLKDNTTFNKFENIFFDGDNKVHTGLRISGNSLNSTYTRPNWKNEFDYCQFRNFNIGLILTSDRDVLDGTQINFASENLFLHCKFKNNKTHIIQENKQSLNNKFEQTDLENETNNDDITSPMIINRSGGGMVFDTCSIMGGATVYYYEYPNNSDNLMDPHYTIFNNCRWEIYQNNSGSFIKQGNTKLSSYQNNFITLKNSMIYFHNSGDDNYKILDYYGRSQILIDNIYIYPNKLLYVLNNITPGSSNTLFSDNSNVKITNCNFRTKIITTGDDERYISKIKINSHKILATDGFVDNGFRNLQNQISNDTYSQNFQNISEKEIAVVYPRPTYTFENQKFILPEGLYLTKLCLFKQGTRHTLDTTINLYMVKNIDQWVDANNFDKTTDAVLIATISTGANKSGYFETNIEYTNNFGFDIRTGKIENYTECRYYLEDTQPSNKTAGIISIKYY